VTPEQIDEKLEFLRKLNAAWHKKINDIADREARLAELGMPNDDDSTTIKEKLITQSDKLLDRIKELENQRRND
jgi:hypothetical protein